jgi:hypothetical protein
MVGQHFLRWGKLHEMNESGISRPQVFFWLGQTKSRHPAKALTCGVSCFKHDHTEIQTLPISKVPNPAAVFFGKDQVKRAVCADQVTWSCDLSDSQSVNRRSLQDEHHL